MKKRAINNRAAAAVVWWLGDFDAFERGDLTRAAVDEIPRKLLTSWEHDPALTPADICALIATATSIMIVDREVAWVHPDPSARQAWIQAWQSMAEGAR